MPLSVEEIRRFEAVEFDVSTLKAKVDHVYTTSKMDHPPLPEFLGEYGLRGLSPPTIAPAALDAMMASLSEADKANLLAMFARALQPAKPAVVAPAPVTINRIESLNPATPPFNTNVFPEPSTDQRVGDQLATDQAAARAAEDKLAADRAASARQL
jgi:hypothetical protein